MPSSRQPRTPRLLHGDYAAVPSRRGDGGTLKIESVWKSDAVFSLRAYTCRRDCDTDEPQTSMAIIERGVIRHTSLAGRYRPVESSR